MKDLKATTLFLFILALPITGAVAQQAPGLKRIGIVLATANTGSENSIYIPALQQRLSELGWKNGNNVTYQVCSAEGSTARATACVDRMVEAHTDLIITQGQFAIEAAMKRAPAIPAVFTMIADPVRLGYVPSLARPGGNVTGFAHFSTASAGNGCNSSGGWLPASIVSRSPHNSMPSAAPGPRKTMQQLPTLS